MKFRDRPVTDEVEINLIPFIDVLLVIMIFLVMTTSYSRFTEIQVNLPNADADTNNCSGHRNCGIKHPYSSQNNS